MCGGKRKQRTIIPLLKIGMKRMQDFILRDRNHRSVVVWSIGNEIPEQ